MPFTSLHKCITRGNHTIQQMFSDLFQQLSWFFHLHVMQLTLFSGKLRNNLDFYFKEKSINHQAWIFFTNTSSYSIYSISISIVYLYLYLLLEPSFFLQSFRLRLILILFLKPILSEIFHNVDFSFFLHSFLFLQPLYICPLISALKTNKI